ncbi:6-phosphofructokinase [Alkalihalobacterium alkalicellulosilyticum]|uniref:6-phosphofructokinase n=1 Tax=Alkalihalobacterium alkalicellulosilyticum TaxID=1912214 RepID=UPI0009979B41|nr:6-phosphofructokinase [Bacillus alkalicellulosilyticus]
MKTGVINVGASIGGLKQYLHCLMERVPAGTTLMGVEFDPETTRFVSKNLLSDEETLSNHQLHPFIKFMDVKQEHAMLFIQAIDEMNFDNLLLIGPLERSIPLRKLLHNVTNILCIPASIYNDDVDSDLTLGYDTALNSIVQAVLQIKDTASSLQKNQTRVFSIQIPGNVSSSLLDDSAISVDGIIVRDESELALARVKTEMERKLKKGATYVFLFMNQDVNPKNLQGKLEAFEPMDFNIVSIDEAQCLGSRPSAFDTVLAGKFATKTVNWLQTSEGESILRYQNNQVLEKHFVFKVKKSNA